MALTSDETLNITHLRTVLELARLGETLHLDPGFAPPPAETAALTRILSALLTCIHGQAPDADDAALQAMLKITLDQSPLALSVTTLDNRFAMEAGWSPVYLLSSSHRLLAAVCSQPPGATGPAPVVFFRAFSALPMAAALVEALPAESREQALVSISAATRFLRLAPLFLNGPGIQADDTHFSLQDPRSSVYSPLFIDTHEPVFEDEEGQAHHVSLFYGWVHTDSEPQLTRNLVKVRCLDTVVRTVDATRLRFPLYKR